MQNCEKHCLSAGAMLYWQHENSQFVSEEDTLMFRVNEDGRFWLSILLLVCCVSFIPLVMISPGGIMVGFIITLISFAAISVTSIIAEWKKIKRPEQTAQAEFIEIGTHLDGDLKSANLKDIMMNTTTCATFKFADETTHKLHFHSSKLGKLLANYENESVQIYYKEHNGKYWLTGFESTAENHTHEEQNKIDFKKPLAILSMAVCALLLTASALAVTGVGDSLDDRINGTVTYSEFKVEPLREFYAEFSVADADGTESIVFAVNADTVYFSSFSRGFEMFLDKDGDGNVTRVCARKEASDAFDESTDEEDIETFEAQYAALMALFDFQQLCTKKDFKNLKVEKIRVETMAGHECVFYSLKGSAGESQLWIDQETNYIIKREDNVDGERWSFLVEKFMDSGFEIPSYQ